MNDIEQILKDLAKRAQNIKMSPAEKSQHRNELMQFMEKAAAMPEVHADKTHLSPQGPGWFFRKMRSAYVAVPMALAVSAGVVFAAQSALPGDLLYGLKVGVIEKVQTGLVFSGQQKAKLDAAFAVRRLEEGEALARQNKLAGELKNELSSHFEEQSAKLMDDINSLKKEHDEATAAEIDSSFAQSLKVHQEIVDVLKENLQEEAGADEKNQTQKELTGSGGTLPELQVTPETNVTNVKSEEKIPLTEIQPDQIQTDQEKSVSGGD